MFNELTVSEQFEIEGGANPAAIVKIIFGIAGLIFTCGAFEGCADEAAKDK